MKNTFTIYIILYSSCPVFLFKDKGALEINSLELFESENIDTLRNKHIEHKVKSIIQSSNIFNLTRKIETTFGFELDLTKAEYESLFIISRNRNILTHNNGIVNSIYLSDLKSFKINSDFKLNETIYPKLDKLSVSILDFIPEVIKKIHNVVITKLPQIKKYEQALIESSR